MDWLLTWLVLALIATMLLSRIMTRMKVQVPHVVARCPCWVCEAKRQVTPTSHPVKTKRGWQYLDEGEPPMDDRFYDAAFPIYTDRQVMETLPDDVRDMLRLSRQTCSGPYREVQGHLWMPTIQALRAEGKLWTCWFCPSVARTTRAALATGTLYDEQRELEEVRANVESVPESSIWALRVQR